ncbi:MAG TPA: VWA domain-containing protein [Blastocatellia bacterium]|nr:VWA domain-containing protein [Blastocatellia bacterium]
MKYISFYLAAAFLMITLTLAPAGRAGGAALQEKPPVPPQKEQKQQKDDKNKKPPEGEAGEDDQEIKIGAQLVTVPFNVTDKKNRYINDLTKETIELSEDGKPQQLFSFERQTDLPITIAMLIDISGSQEYTLPAEKAAGQRFFRKVLRPNKDIAAVVTFEHESVLVQDLTSNVERLHQALDDVRLSVTNVSRGTVGGTPPISGSGAGSTSMYDSIYSVSSDLLRREAGRRVIILITDGHDTSSSVKMRDAIERTWRNEVIVYSIGIGDPSYGVNSGDLKKIASETGGRAFFPRDEEDLDKAFALIDEDLRSQYILSYTPSNEARDGSFRAIQVKVKNQKDLTVRHRRGYFAPKE